MSNSYIKTLDLGMAALLYSQFSDDLSLGDNYLNSVVRAPKSIALRLLAEKRERTELEFISFWKSSLMLDWARLSAPAALTGFSTVSTGTMTTIKAVPVSLQYSVWFWSVYPDRLNDVLETYLFWKMKNPNMTLTYNDTYTLEYDLKFGEAIDESTLSEKFDKGLIYCYRAPITVEAWILDSTTSSSAIIEKAILHTYDASEIDIDLITEFNETSGVYEGDAPDLDSWEVTEDA